MSRKASKREENMFSSNHWNWMVPLIINTIFGLVIVSLNIHHQSEISKINNTFQKSLEGYKFSLVYAKEKSEYIAEQYQEAINTVDNVHRNVYL